MCLPDFIKFENVLEDKPLTGYREWLLSIRDENKLKSINQNYEWNKAVEGPHEVLNINSGIYAYNNYKYNNYYIQGIISQWGKTAIHEIGRRSEYAKIDTIFTIRESSVKGPKEFIEWIKLFNNKIEQVAKQFNAKVITWQDFIDSQMVNK